MANFEMASFCARCLKANFRSILMHSAGCIKRLCSVTAFLDIACEQAFF